MVGPILPLATRASGRSSTFGGSLPELVIEGEHDRQVVVQRTGAVIVSRQFVR